VSAKFVIILLKTIYFYVGGVLRAANDKINGYPLINNAGELGKISLLPYPFED